MAILVFLILIISFIQLDRKDLIDISTTPPLGLKSCYKPQKEGQCFTKIQKKLQHYSIHGLIIGDNTNAFHLAAVAAFYFFSARGIKNISEELIPF